MSLMSLVALATLFLSTSASITQHRSISMLRNSIDQCSPYDVVPEERCNHVQIESCRSISGIFDFLTFTYCTLPTWMHGSFLMALAISLFVQASWLCFCFLIMIIVCDRFFVPSVERISDFLKLSPAVAGVTLLSLGSSGADIFTQISMASSTSDVGKGIELSLSEPMGNGLFITTCVTGLIAIFAPTPAIELNRSLFLKDCFFYLGGILGIYIVLLSGHIHHWQLSIAGGWYLLYILATIVLSRVLHQEPLHSEPAKHEVPLPSFRTTSFRLDRRSAGSSARGGGSLIDETDSLLAPLMEGEEDDIEEGWGSEETREEEEADEFQDAKETLSVLGGSSVSSSSSPSKARGRTAPLDPSVPSTSLSSRQRSNRSSRLGSSRDGESGLFYDAESQRGTSFVPSLALSSVGSVGDGELEGSSLPHDQLSLFSFPLILPPENGSTMNGSTMNGSTMNERDATAFGSVQGIPAQPSGSSSHPSSSKPASRVDRIEEISPLDTPATSSLTFKPPSPVPPLPLHKLPAPSEFYHDIHGPLTPLRHPIHPHRGVTTKNKGTIWRLFIRGPIQWFISLTLPLVSNRKGSGVIYPKSAVALLPFALPVLIATHIWPEWLSGPKVPGEGPIGWSHTHPVAASCILVACGSLSFSALLFYPKDGRLREEGYGLILGIFTLIAFLGSVLWMEFLAGEIVATTASLGIILDIPSTLLAVTLLSWGNSSSDVAANLSLAADGFPTMALAACFGSPLMVLLGGLFFSLVSATGNSGQSWPVNLPDNADLQFLLLSDAACVIVLMLSVTLMGFRLNKWTTLCGLVSYVLSISVYVYTSLKRH